MYLHPCSSVGGVTRKLEICPPYQDWAYGCVIGSAALAQCCRDDGGGSLAPEPPQALQSLPAAGVCAQRGLQQPSVRARLSLSCQSILISSHCKFLLPSLPPTPFNPHAAPTPILSFHAFYKELSVALRPPRQDGLLLVRMGWEVGLRPPRQDGLLLVRMGCEVGLRPPRQDGLLLVRMGWGVGLHPHRQDGLLLVRMGWSVGLRPPRQDGLLLVRMGWEVGLRPPRQDGLLLVRMGWGVGLPSPPHQDGLLLVRMGWGVGLRPPRQDGLGCGMRNC